MFIKIDQIPPPAPSQNLVLLFAGCGLEEAPWQRMTFVWKDKENAQEGLFSPPEVYLQHFQIHFYNWESLGLGAALFPAKLKDFSRFLSQQLRRNIRRTRTHGSAVAASLTIVWVWQEAEKAFQESSLFQRLFGNNFLNENTKWIFFLLLKPRFSMWSHLQREFDMFWDKGVFSGFVSHFLCFPTHSLHYFYFPYSVLRCVCTPGTRGGFSKGISTSWYFWEQLKYWPIVGEVGIVKLCLFLRQIFTDGILVSQIKTTNKQWTKRKIKHDR